MRGFQPGKARAAAQNYADGGIVGSIKSALGFGKKKPEPLPADLNKLPPTGAGPAASQPQPQPQQKPEKAISQYSGMSALERRMKEADAYADGGLVRTISDAVRPFSESVGGYWSNSNKEFEATNPGVGARFDRALNPVTGFGSAVGAMYDAAGNGSARDAAIAAAQAAPMFAAMKVVPAAKSLLPTAPQVAASVGKTASKVANSTSAGVVADEAQARGFANGGLVRGPGTGISDDIEDEVEEGTFIMPADSTEAMGKETMEKLGNAKVPVNLSNGEAKLPPEALQAIGAEVMEAIKNVTHTPAAVQAQGFPGAQESAAGRNFADGGVVGGKKRLHLADGDLATQERLKREGMTVADRARSPAFGFGAAKVDTSGMTPLPRAQAPATAPAATTSAQVQRAGNSFSAAPAQPKAPSQPAAPSASNPVRRDRGMPAPVEYGSTSPSMLYMQDRAAEASDQLKAGNVAGAVGTGFRTALQGSGMYALEGADRLVSPWLEAGGRLVGGLLGTDTADGRVAASSAPVAQSQAKVSVADPSNAGAGRGNINPDRVNPNAPPPKSPGPQAAEVSPGVFRVGNSFGDSAQAAVDGARPSAGPSARNMEAMNNLVARDPVAGAMDRALGVERDPAQAATGFSQGGARQAPAAAPASAAASSAVPATTTARGFQPAGQSAQPGSSPMEMYARQAEAMRGLTEAQRALDQYGPGSGGQGGGTYIKHSGNDWETEKNLKNLRTSASSITNRPGRRGEPSVEQQAYLKALDADMAARSGNNPAAIEAMRQQGETARFNAREAGENTRAGMRNTADARRDSIAAQLAQDKLDLERTAQGFQTRALQRQEQLQADYDAADTPEKRAAIAQKIRDMSGKQQDMRDNFMVVGGGQEWDAQAGSMRNVPQRLIDLRTSQEVGTTGQGGKPQPAPADPKERKVGSVYVAPNGAKVQWDGQGWTAA